MTYCINTKQSMLFRTIQTSSIREHSKQELPSSRLTLYLTLDQMNCGSQLVHALDVTKNGPYIIPRTRLNTKKLQTSHHKFNMAKERLWAINLRSRYGLETKKLMRCHVFQFMNYKTLKEQRPVEYQVQAHYNKKISLLFCQT